MLFLDNSYLKEFESNIAIFYEILTNSKVFMSLIDSNDYQTLSEIGNLSNIIADFDSSYQRTDPYLLSTLFNTMHIRGDLSMDNKFDNHVNIMSLV